MLSLKAEKRSKADKIERLRQAGQIPAVYYGKKQPSTPITVGSIDFTKVWKAAGESTVVTLETPEGKVESLIHDIDVDPVSGRVRHADFYVFEKGHKVKIDVPLAFTGVSPAVKDLGGTLVKVLYALKVEAEPHNLPHEIEVDISPLETFEHQLLARGIKLPKGVELMEKDDEVVALVSAPREEKEEEVKPIDLSAIEVEKKGKESTAEAGTETGAATPEAK